MNGLGNPLILASMALTSVSLAKNKNFIKENWKPILGIGATIGVTYVVWTIYSDWKDNSTPGGLDKNSKFPPSTLTASEALMKANRLQEAMGTFGDSNEEEVNEIKSILQGLTYNDYIKVSQAFGERGYITMTGISKDSDWLAPKKDLTYWLSKELEPGDLNSLRQVIPNVF